MKMLLVVALMAVGLSGCGARDFLKQIESGAYDAAARGVSEYCERADRGVVAGERVEARREIRQRGKDGPAGPNYVVRGLDAKTAHGSGPVVRIWCVGEEVPEAVWQDLVR